MGERPNDGRDWISTNEAAERVGLTVWYFLDQANKRGLARFGERPWKRPYWFLREEIETWAKLREVRQEWRERHRRASSQTRRTDRIDPKLAEELFINSDEAAAILGVTRRTVSALVQRGRLVSYQEEPGHNGKRLWFSRRAVEQITEDPEWVKHRAAYGKAQETAERRRGKGGHREPENVPPTGARWDKTLPPGWIPAREAAKRLGVSQHRVNELRRLGRLFGMPRWRKYKPIRGWYYHEDSLTERLSDEVYQRMRATYEAECAKKVPTLPMP